MMTPKSAPTFSRFILIKLTCACILLTLAAWLDNTHASAYEISEEAAGGAPFIRAD